MNNHIKWQIINVKITFYEIIEVKLSFIDVKKQNSLLLFGSKR